MSIDMVRAACVALVLAVRCAVELPAAEAQPSYEPTENYTQRQIHGWTVYVHRSLLEEQKSTGDRVLELLAVKLYDIQQAVPAKAVEKLRKIPIWLEYNNKPVRCACFHPSKQWLKANGFNPNKAGAVEIGNAETFIRWSRHQPSMVLHELAHRYHWHFLGGYDNPEIAAAFKRAKEAGIYESVLYFDGSKKRAYALNNPQEYFAELSEAWFGVNDFYPFVRAEVLVHDPEMAKLLRKLWHE